MPSSRDRSGTRRLRKAERDAVHALADDTFADLLPILRQAETIMKDRLMQSPPPLRMYGLQAIMNRLGAELFFNVELAVASAADADNRLAP